MRVFLLPHSYSGQRHLMLGKKDYHYLIRVLRYCEGTGFTGRAPDGTLWRLLINRINAREKCCEITCTPFEEQSQQPSEILPEADSLPEIHLYQSMLKGKKFDTLLRQMVEIGITRIIPLESDYTVAKGISREAEHKLRRWSHIRDEALQQSGSAVITRISHPVSFEQIRSDWNGRGLALFFHHEPVDPRSLQEVISDFAQQNTGLGSFPTALIIGPEGGFSDDEVEKMKSWDFRPAYLRTNILRAETAALYGASCTQMLLTDLSDSA